MMGYIFMFITILMSVAGNVSVKLSNGFKKKLYAIMSFVFFTLCILFLTLTVNYIDISIAYAIWSGASISIVAIIGILFFNESKSIKKCISICLIMLGVMILHLSTT